MSDRTKPEIDAPEGPAPTELVSTDEILGARLFHVDAQEVINLIALAMRAGTTATQLRDGIWTHPSSTEALNETLGKLAPVE